MKNKLQTFSGSKIEGINMLAAQLRHIVAVAVHESSNEFIVMGFYTSFGTVFVALITEFKASESLAAWIGSVSFSVCYLSSMIVSFLVIRIGYRAVCCFGALCFGLGLLLSSFVESLPVLFATYGVLFGIGCGFVHFASVLVLPKFFKFKRGLAFGIALSGHGVGALPMGYLTEFLISKFGLKITLRLTAMLALPLFAGGLTFGSASDKKECRMEKECKSLKIEKQGQKIWKNKALLAHCAALWMFAFGYYIPSVHLVNMAEGLGVPMFKATLLPSSIAISQSIGKIVFGQLAMLFRGVNAVYFCQATMFACGLVTTLCPLMTGFGGLLSYTIIYGFCDSCSTIFTLNIIEDIVGESNVSAGYALQYVGMAIFMLIGPPAAGFIYEATGSYQIPFILSGAFSTLCVCIMFLTPLLKDKQPYDMKLIEEFSRKDSVDSSSSEDSNSSKFSNDSGISLQNEKFVIEDSWSRKDSSGTSSIASLASKAPSLSDYESDSVGIDIISIELQKEQSRNDDNNRNNKLRKIDHHKSIAEKKDFNVLFWTKGLEFVPKTEPILFVERETVL